MVGSLDGFFEFFVKLNLFVKINKNEIFCIIFVFRLISHINKLLIIKFTFVRSSKVENYGQKIEVNEGINSYDAGKKRLLRYFRCRKECQRRINKKSIQKISPTLPSR